MITPKSASKILERESMKNLLQKAAFASAAGLLAMGAIVTKVGAEGETGAGSVVGGIVGTAVGGAVGGGSDMINLTNVTPQNVNVATNASTLIRTIITLVIIVAALLTLFYLIMGAIA